MGQGGTTDDESQETPPQEQVKQEYERMKGSFLRGQTLLDESSGKLADTATVVANHTYICLMRVKTELDVFFFLIDLKNTMSLFGKPIGDEWKQVIRLEDDDALRTSEGKESIVSYITDKFLTVYDGKIVKLTLRQRFFGDQIALPSLSELTNLTHIDVSHNQLSSLPPDLPELTNLTHLVVSCNNLTSLPDLPAGLREFTASNNRLTKLQEYLPVGLRELTVSDNLLTQLPEDLPAKLRSIYVYNNKLAELPQNLYTLTFLLNYSRSLL